MYLTNQIMVAENALLLGIVAYDGRGASLHFEGEAVLTEFAGGGLLGLLGRRDLLMAVLAWGRVYRLGLLLR